jgi:hypothetical protein
MKIITVARVREALSAAALLGIVGLACGCYGEVDAGGPAYYPPPSFIATAQPVYYDGHASYWYDNHWVYRDGGGWSTYRSEPPYLAQRRVQAGPARRTYERPVARPQARQPQRR